MVQILATARILVAIEGLGTSAHDSDIPFLDASRDPFRESMGVSADQFYDESSVAIVPMGLCYPGRLQSGGDARLHPECAPLWRNRLLAQIPDLRLRSLVGGHSQTGAFGPGTMTERVMGFRDRLSAIFPLPHPSWRCRHRATRHPWFDVEGVPALRDAARRALA